MEASRQSGVEAKVTGNGLIRGLRTQGRDLKVKVTHNGVGLGGEGETRRLADDKGGS